METDVRIDDAALFLLPVKTRVPLAFGSETVTSITCLRASVRVSDRFGNTATGWGETPLNISWAWPGSDTSGSRRDELIAFAVDICARWRSIEFEGHPLEIGHFFLTRQVGTGSIPPCARRLCIAPFDLATHDAYGKLHGHPTYRTYNRRYMNRDLEFYFGDTEPGFAGRFPDDYLKTRPARTLPAWHLVGIADPINEDDLPAPVRDNRPVYLDDWIVRNGLKYLKIKLTGTNPDWDFRRTCAVGRIALRHEVTGLSVDFNCTVTSEDTVMAFLDRLEKEAPEIHALLLYVEQPFPATEDLTNRTVTEISRRKPLFMDESALSWKDVRKGTINGWTGVALKTCKSQTASILMYCWARHHEVPVMVQDLTNPMLAQISHLQLAAHVNSAWGVETNSMQYYPDASAPEARIHPGAYERVNGRIDLTTCTGSGFGYRIEEINRTLPPRVA